MKVISEYKLTQDQIKEYRNKGYEVYYGYENPNIKPGESVGFLLDNLYSSTINLIETLLHRKTKSKISIKYKDKSYNLSIPDEWQYKYYDDQLKRWISVQHPILKEYFIKRSEYFEEKKQAKETEHMNYLLSCIHEIPKDLDLVLNTYSRLYEVDNDGTLESKLRAYMSIQYYLTHNIEYSKDILGKTPEEETMFDCVSFGDETYMEDYIYQNI